MESATISPKFQVVIPKATREQLRLRPGQKVRVIAYAGRIELIPERRPSEARGSLRGMDTSVPRERDRL